ncbi:MAG: cysteine--tRNA ligase [Puniceicoccaceae bacterium]
MRLSLHNTLTRSSEPVLPSDGQTLRFYCCGPTVYGPAHIGNLRTFVAQDLFRRVVEFFGTPTLHVRNITDVDDKTIRDSQGAGVPLSEFTEMWRSRFNRDCATLNLLPPHHAPSAVGHLADQVELIETLIRKGNAYPAENGSIYFRIDSFPEYGKLSGLRPTEIRQNASDRLVEADEYDKESWRDFALWKAWKPQDGVNRWPSPWGDGRPGWHIECSAMSMRYLGPSFDLHSGGVDLIFPHHENEIAQSEAATGKPFARHWFHVAHLRVDGGKMSKSLGNLFTLEDVVERGFTAPALRYLLISGHYRQPLNFTWESLAGADRALNRILKHLDGSEHPPEGEASLSSMETDAFTATLEALSEDLNTAKALGSINATLNEHSKDGLSQPLRRDLARILDLLGISFRTPASPLPSSVPADIEELASQRQQARVERRWQDADALRAQLSDAGWKVRDLESGYELTPKV